MLGHPGPWPLCSSMATCIPLLGPLSRWWEGCLPGLSFKVGWLFLEKEMVDRAQEMMLWWGPCFRHIPWAVTGIICVRGHVSRLCPAGEEGRHAEMSPRHGVEEPAMRTGSKCWLGFQRAGADRKANRAANFCFQHALRAGHCGWGAGRPTPEVPRLPASHRPQGSPRFSPPHPRPPGTQAPVWEVPVWRHREGKREPARTAGLDGS